MPDEHPQHGRHEDYDELWRKAAHTDAEVASIRTQLGSVATSVSRIEQAVLNRPGINWVAVVTMFGGLLTLVGGAFVILLSQVSLMMEPIINNVEDNSDVIEEVREDVRRLVRDSAVNGERINRIDQYGSSNWINYKRENKVEGSR